jgi:hypothetical protein
VIVPHPTLLREQKLAEDLALWRLCHQAVVNHLARQGGCQDCGMELCPDGQTLWLAADEAERALPWCVS